MILQSANLIKPVALFVNRDIVTDTMEKQKEQLEKVKEAKRPEILL